MKMVVGILLFLILPISAWAACSWSGGNTTAASCTAASINDCLDDASCVDGSIINIPACGTSGSPVALGGDVSITEGVILQGAGSTSTFVSGGSFTISSVSNGARITGINSKDTDYNISRNGWRIDHNTIRATSEAYLIDIDNTNIDNDHQSSGLIDNNSFRLSRILLRGTRYPETTANASSIWNLSDGAGVETNTVYVEDNTFGDASDDFYADCLDSNYGGRVVFRYNTLVNTSKEHHGIQSTSNRGAMLTEIYENTFSADWSMGLLFRSGSGFIYNNTFSGYASPILMDNQTSYRYGAYSCNNLACDGNIAQTRDGNRTGMNGYPCRDQIGRGRDTTLWAVGEAYTQSLFPLYIWNNTDGGVQQTPSLTEMGNQCGGTNLTLQPSHIVANRDYYAGGYSVQVSSSSPFNGTSGVGWGTLANRPTTCTHVPVSTGLDSTDQASSGVGYWATDESKLYRCSATNTWTVHYQPAAYPHSLQGSTTTTTASITGVSVTGVTIQ